MKMCHNPQYYLLIAHTLQEQCQQPWELPDIALNNVLVACTQQSLQQAAHWTLSRTKAPAKHKSQRGEARQAICCDLLPAPALLPEKAAHRPHEALQVSQEAEIAPCDAA